MRALKVQSPRAGGIAAPPSRCSTCISRSTCTVRARASQHDAWSEARAPEKSLFRRPIPEALIALSSTEGRRRFLDAQLAGSAEPFLPLMEQFVTQNEPTYCGLGSLTMVMNALRIDPRRRWRDETGPGWRWWSDEMFLEGTCTPTLAELKADGVGMDELATIATTSGADVSVHRPTDEGASIDSFREAVFSASRMQAEAFLVSSFCRASLGQTGGGHFSPIGAYHEASDSVLVLDVARWKYPPFFVGLRQLWSASATIDSATGRSRGWLLLSAAPDVAASAPVDPLPKQK